MSGRGGPRRRRSICVLIACTAPRLGVNLSLMSKVLQIRDVPDDVHRALRIRAAAQGLSLSTYALRALTEVAGRPDASDILRRSGERGGGARTADIVATIRESRDRDAS
jgi:antitoxin FitA